MHLHKIAGALMRRGELRDAERLYRQAVMLEDALPRMASLGLLVRIPFPAELLQELRASNDDDDNDNGCSGLNHCNEDDDTQQRASTPLTTLASVDINSVTEVAQRKVQVSAAESPCELGGAGCARSDGESGAAVSDRGQPDGGASASFGLSLLLKTLTSRGGDLEHLRVLANADKAALSASLRQLGYTKLGERLRIEHALRSLPYCRRAAVVHDFSE